LLFFASAYAITMLPPYYAFALRAIRLFAILSRHYVVYYATAMRAMLRCHMLPAYADIATIRDTRLRHTNAKNVVRSLIDDAAMPC